MSNVSNKRGIAREVKRVKVLSQDMQRIGQFLKGDCVVLTVKDDTLIVDAGNKSPQEVKDLANTFFRHAYELPTIRK